MLKYTIVSHLVDIRQADWGKSEMVVQEVNEANIPTTEGEALEEIRRMLEAMNTCWDMLLGTCETRLSTTSWMITVFDKQVAVCFNGIASAPQFNAVVAAVQGLPGTKFESKSTPALSAFKVSVVDDSPLAQQRLAHAIEELRTIVYV